MAGRRTCPDCGAMVRIRNSWAKHKLLHYEYIQCQNILCGAVFRVQREFTHRMNPGGMPAPDVPLPLAPSAIRHEAAHRTAPHDQPDLLSSLYAEESNHEN